MKIRHLTASLLAAAGLLASPLPALALDANGYTTAGDAACWTNPACALPRGGDSDVMTVYNPDGSIYRQIFAFGGEETNNVYYFDPNEVAVDASQYGRYTTLRDSDGTWSDLFGVYQVSLGVYALGFASDPYAEAVLYPPLQGLTFTEVADIPNPVPGQEDPYLTIAYDATRYLDPALQAAGYTATFRSDAVPEPASLALVGLGLGALLTQRRRRAAA